MTKIPPKSKKWPKFPRNLKITKISPIPKKWPKYPQNLKITKIEEGNNREKKNRIVGIYYELSYIYTLHIEEVDMNKKSNVY